MKTRMSRRRFGEWIVTTSALTACEAQLLGDRGPGDAGAAATGDGGSRDDDGGPDGSDAAPDSAPAPEPSTSDRRWTRLVMGPRWYNEVHRGGANVVANEERAPYLMDPGMFALPCFGGPVEEVDESGHFTGKWLLFTGGDGGYAGNETVTIRLDRIAGGVVPMRSNLADDAASAAEWRNRVRATTWEEGGVQWQEDMAIHPDDPSDFQHMAGHTGSGDSYVPGYGRIVDAWAPEVLPALADVTYGGRYPWILRATQLVPPVDANPKIGRYVVSWSDSGPDAGRFVRRVPRNGQLDYDMLAEWSPITRKVLHVTSGSGFYTEVAEIDVATGTWAYRGRAIVPNRDPAFSSVQGLTASRGSRTSCCRWLEGTRYLTISNHASSDGTFRKVCVLDIASLDGTTEPVMQTILHNDVIDDWQSSEKHLAVAFDRPSRTIYWLVRDAGSYLQPFRIHRSSYDAPVDFEEVDFEGRGTLALMPEPTGYGTRCWSVFGGHLYMISGGDGGMPGDGNASGSIWRLAL